MVELKLEWDASGMPVFKDRKLEKALFRALKKAGGDGIRKARTDSKRTVREKKKIKAGQVAKSMRLRFPRGGGIDGLVWTLNVKAAAQPLAAFPVRQNKRGVVVSVNQGRSAQLVTSAFIATMRNGHRGVFLRRGKSRLPIRELFSTRVTDVFNDNGMVRSIFDSTQKTFQASFKRLLPLEMAK